MSRDTRIAKLTAAGLSRKAAADFTDREHGWAYLKVRPFWHRRIAEHARSTGQSAGDVVAWLVDSYLRGERTMADNEVRPRFVTIKDAYDHFVGLCGGEETTVRTMDELREEIQSRGLRYEDITDGNLWDELFKSGWTCGEYGPAPNT